MWITAILGFISVFSQCNSQELTSLNAQTVTETPRVNQAIDWDTTLPSVTLRIQDGRINVQNKPQNEIPEHPLVYSNQWRPFIMPMGFNPFMDQNNREENIHRQPSIEPTFLRRPDSNLNWTTHLYPSAYPYDTINANSESSQAVRSPSSTVDPKSQLSNTAEYTFIPSPLRPFFHPYPVYVNGRDSNQQNYIKEIQNSSESVSRPLFYESITTRSQEEPSRLLPTNNIHIPPYFPGRFTLSNNYESQRGFLPPFAPMYYPPYPILPPIRNVNAPHFDREEGSGVVESSPPEYDLPTFDLPISGNRPNNERNPPTIPPYGAIPSFIPPVPAGAFPFALTPPPVFPPFLPNPVASRILPSLQPDSTNTPKENPIVDIIPVPLQTEDRLPLEPIEVTGDALSSGIELSSNLENVKQDLFESDKPNIVKIPYEFGYDMNDGKGTDQHRMEVSDGSGVVTGSYGYRDAFGVYRLVNYVADENGFRAFIKSNEPGVASSGSADVVVEAENPPPHAIAEGAKVPELEAIIVPDETVDLIAQGSEK